MPLTIHDVLLPKHVTDSCYASITQIYREMFELTPKSNLKLSNSRTNLKENSRHSSFNLGSLDKHRRHLEYNRNQNIEQGMRSSRINSLGAMKKPALATPTSHGQYNVRKELRRSERKYDKYMPHPTKNEHVTRIDNSNSGPFHKKDKMRASWHEGDFKNKVVVGTKIEFNTRF